jgi:glycosyltransferase involved in cell wall biosynthesis
MRIAYFPNWPKTSYLRLYFEALRPFGVEGVPQDSVPERPFAEGDGGVDAVHFHWVEGVIGDPLLRRRIQKVVLLGRYCRSARARGVPIVHTVHNHESHEGSWLTRWASRLVIRHADLLICHSEWSAAHIAAASRPRGRIVVMPHGNYDGCYRGDTDVREARTRLGLNPDAPVVGVLGSIRRYRGHEDAIDAVARLGGRVQLILAGRPHDKAFSARLRYFIRAYPYMRYPRGGRLSDDAFAAAVQVCDAVLLPYRHVTTSGALLAALTLSRPVVAYDAPYFREILGRQPRASALVAKGDRQALAAGIEAILAVDRREREGAARALAEDYAWDAVIQPVARLLPALMRGS